MKRENVLMALLAGTSVVLVVLVVLTAGARGPVLAQSVDRSGGFVMATGPYDENIDALYLLDERSGQMAVFLSRRGGRDMKLTDVRDLTADFDIKMEVPGAGVRPHKQPKR